MIQDSFKIEAKVMESSESMTWECNLFTHQFIGFRAKENMEIKLKSDMSYISITTSSNSYNIPHTNMIQDSFKIEAKVMETSDPMAGECNISHMSFSDLDPQRIWK